MTKPTRKWADTHGTYIAGRSYVDEADFTAQQIEAKWGVGRLRLLVSPDLRERFDKQRLKFNAAVWHGQDLEEVREQSNRMVKAYLALDKAAEAAGHKPTPPEAIECVLKDGTVAVIVPDNAPAGLVGGDGRQKQVYLASEIARLLDGYPLLVAVKEKWPGATVTAVRGPSDPLDAFTDSRGGVDAPMVDDDLSDFPSMGI